MTNHEKAWADVNGTFHSNCSRPLAEQAENKLSFFFELTVGALIDAGKMGWQEPEEASKREFVLRCTRDAAKFAEREAGAVPVTAEIMTRAAQQLVDVEKSCPLPPHPKPDPRKRGSACAELEDTINRELRKDEPINA